MSFPFQPDRTGQRRQTREALREVGTLLNADAVSARSCRCRRTRHASRRGSVARFSRAQLRSARYAFPLLTPFNEWSNIGRSKLVRTQDFSHQFIFTREIAISGGKSDWSEHTPRFRPV